MTNKEIANYFSLLAKLSDIHNENSFKSKAYSVAAFQIDKLGFDVENYPKEKLAAVFGIGDSNAKKIIEILETGKLEALDELLAKTPEGIQELMSIKGIGPKKIATIWHELGIESPGELLYACDENRLIAYKGFGEKTQQTIKEALEFYLSNQQRYLYASIEPIALALEKKLQQLFSHCEVKITGAFVRQCEIIDELAYVIACSEEEIIETISSQNGFVFQEDDNGILKFMLNESIHIEIHACDENTFVETLFFTTNSADFNEAFQSHFEEVVFEGNESEEAIFEQAEIEFIEPCLRENEQSILLAKENNLPILIQPKDVKGVVHNHSKWSDGKNTIEEMALACIQNGYEYLVMSDHSVSSFYANGLSIERIEKQQDEIDVLNKKLAPFKIFKSIECDILNDGRLDYEEAVLATFDLVICSVHQNLKMTEEKAMQRILTAIENPYCHILGHPTGRLLLSRKGYPIDHIKIIEACIKNNVVIEINANPRRLDMDWRFIEQAIEMGAMLSINPDAHSLEGIDDIRLGVLASQKGMLTQPYNLSSLSLPEFEDYLKNLKLKN
jgi:DNA polymerase (family 10)